MCPAASARAGYRLAIGARCARSASATSIRDRWIRRERTGAAGEERRTWDMAAVYAEAM